MKIIRTHRVSGNARAFKNLVQHLDRELADRDGDEHAFYNQFNGIEDIEHAVVVTVDDEPASCGAIRPFDEHTAEVKRMYTLPEYRGHRLGAVVLNELERWSEELGFLRCILETGKRQPEAIRLCQRSGYDRTDNFPPYVGVENSVCFEKKLS